MSAGAQLGLFRAGWHEVAALFVRADGPYPGLVRDWYDEARDARNYTGPWPVVAHPPCERWGNYWYKDGSTEPGNDGGLFAFTLAQLRRVGGVLEHPKGSRAWPRFGLHAPVFGCWTRASETEWVTEIRQCSYAHEGEKATWLYYVSPGGHAPPEALWTETRADVRPVEHLSHRQRELTPYPLAEYLCSCAHRAGSAR